MEVVWWSINVWTEHLSGRLLIAVYYGLYCALLIASLRSVFQLVTPRSILSSHPSWPAPTLSLPRPSLS